MACSHTGSPNALPAKKPRITATVTNAAFLTVNEISRIGFIFLANSVIERPAGFGGGSPTGR